MPSKCVFSQISFVLHAAQANPWSLLTAFLLHFLSSVFQIFPLFSRLNLTPVFSHSLYLPLFYGLL